MEQEQKRTGTLRVRVFATQAELPVQGATVVVIRRAVSGKYDLLSVQATDSSGLIQPVAIEAPPAEESTEPEGADGGEPYTSCDVWAEHPGYAMLQVDGVQIFRGVETVQNMELTPLAPGVGGWKGKKEFSNPKQDL